MEAGTGATGLQDIDIITDDEFEPTGEEAVDVLEPEDITQEILNETVEETTKRIAGALKEEEPNAANGQSAGNQGQTGDGRARDANGRFLAKSGEQPAQQQGQQQQVAQPAAQGAVEAPQRFSPAAREAWKAAPPVLQQEYVKLVRDTENGRLKEMREIHGIRTEAERVVNAVAPYAKDWAQAGYTPGQGMALLAQTHENLIKKPVETLAQLARDNGINLDDVKAVLEGRAPSGANGNGQGYVPPEVQKQLADLANWKASVDNERRAAQERQAGEQSTARVRALASEKDERGNDRYPGMLNQAFLDEAQPLVMRLRTPTRGLNGETIPGMDVVEAYQTAYARYGSKYAHTPQGHLNGNQPLNQTTRSQPVTMRPRSAPVSGTTPLENVEMTPQILRESVDEMMARLRRERGA